MKKRILSFLFLGLATMLPSFATQFTGSATGCFYDDHHSCTPTSQASYDNLLGELTFNGSSFDRIGTGTIQLGTFDLDALFSAPSANFDLNVSFTNPADISGSYTASLTGFVFFGFGGDTITFNNPRTDLLTYPGGSFKLTVPQSILIAPGCSDAALFATISHDVTSAPEPASLAFAGGALSLFGLIGIRRRNRKQQQ